MKFLEKVDKWTIWKTIMQYSIDIILFLLALSEDLWVDWVDNNSDINIRSYKVTKEIIVVYDSLV